MKKKIDLFKVFMSDTASDKVKDVISSGFIGQGPRVEEFETLLKQRINNDYVLTLNSGTSGLHLAIHMLKSPNKWNDGIGPDDEILCTALTCTASNWPVLANDVKIKWVDVDPKTINMDLDDLERKLTKNTKAIITVHWGGNPVNLDRLKKIQDKSLELFGFKPAIIEDCAHAFGSKYNNEYLGNHDNICMYSFQAIKHLTTIDGGMLVLPTKELYDKGKLLRWYGIDRETNTKDFRCEADIKEWGFKFHMNDVCAAVGIENLKVVDELVINKHKANAKYYNDQLKDISGITLLETNPCAESAYWIYSLLVDNKNDFMKHMAEHNIAVSQVHERNDTHSCVAEFKSSLPNLDTIRERLISIPVGWWITKEDREYIVDTMSKGW